MMLLTSHAHIHISITCDNCWQFNIITSAFKGASLHELIIYCDNSSIMRIAFAYNYDPALSVSGCLHKDCTAQNQTNNTQAQ